MSRSAGRMIGRLREKGIGVVGSAWDAGYCIAEISACADFSFLRGVSSAIMSLWGFWPGQRPVRMFVSRKAWTSSSFAPPIIRACGIAQSIRRATQKPTLVYVIDAMAVCLHEQISIGHYITQRTSIVAIVSEWISEIATFRTI